MFFCGIGSPGLSWMRTVMHVAIVDWLQLKSRFLNELQRMKFILQLVSKSSQCAVMGHTTNNKCSCKRIATYGRDQKWNWVCLIGFRWRFTREDEERCCIAQNGVHWSARLWQPSAAAAEQLQEGAETSQYSSRANRVNIIIIINVLIWCW